MARIDFKKELCKGCALCVEACPQKIIALSDKTNNNGYNVAECVDMSKCIGCANCAVMCPDCVIDVER